MYQIQCPNVVNVVTSTHIDLGFRPHRSVNSTFKRCVDIIGSLLGLLILAIVFLPVAIAIKLDSPGPIFYCQERYGLGGRPFKLRKFRSMVTNADDLKRLVPNQASGMFFKNENDFRVTKVGKFLRRTSLDELPQFWNVLMGDMSLVGTRPPTVDEVIRYNERHWLRLNVKPGLTGEWQVNGRSKVKNFEKVVDLDLRYQDKWHPLYDLFVIFKTIMVILAKEGAS